MNLKTGDKVLVYGQWHGVVKGPGHRAGELVVQYRKHKSNLIGSINVSRLSRSKA